ncbi:MAG: TAXI family TRAP transporter solute-binding subunit [Chloroflexi bacterium]|nr:TAXI family TRAP transporter solute-binding subunit [Chloroflexota bacterium]
MRRSSLLLGGLVVLALLALACGPAAPAAQPAKPAAEPAKPAASAAEMKPAAPAQAAQPAKPAAPAAPAQAAKPAVQPVKPAASKEMRQLIHGTSQLSSAYGIYGAALVKLLNSSVPGVNITLAEYGGVVNNLKLAREGKVDFALGDHVITYKAYLGELKGWENNPQKDVRLLWIFDPSILAYVVSERAGIKQFSDLNGKPFSPGGQGTNAETVTTEVFDVLGIRPQYYRGSMSEMVDAFKDRRAVGFVKSTSLERADPIILDAMTNQPLRILTWSEDAVKKVQAKYRYYKTTQIPAGVYKGDWNAQPIVSWSTPVSIWTTTKLPEDLAYQFTKIVLADKTEQAAAFPAVKGVDIGKLTVQMGIVPLHKGALKAMQEAGKQVPNELVPPEAQ